MDEYYYCLTSDATRIVSYKCSIIGKQVAVIFFYITGYHSNNMTMLKTPLSFKTLRWLWTYLILRFKLFQSVALYHAYLNWIIKMGVTELDFTVHVVSFQAVL